MQFYKKRDFGELISATFDFLKLYGRDYFKKYIIINGLIIILLLIVIVIGFGEFIAQMFSSNLGGEQFYFEDYFAQNTTVLIMVGIISIIIFMLLSLVSYSFPVLYMKRVSESSALTVTIDEMTSDIKSIIPKFLIFFFGMMFFIVPISFIIIGISVALMMILIGFLLIMLIAPAMLNVINFSFFHYYHTNDGYFASIRYALNAVLSKSFWKYWGSITIMYLIIQVITSVFSFLPIIIITGSEFVDSSGMDAGSDDLFGIVIISIYAISIVASLILTNLLYVNTGFMYYDTRTDLHRNQQFSEIDSIGKSEV